MCPEGAGKRSPGKGKLFGTMEHPGGLETQEKLPGGFTIKQLLQVLPRRVEQEFGSWLLETFINPKSGR